MLREPLVRVDMERDGGRRCNSLIFSGALLSAFGLFQFYMFPTQSACLYGILDQIFLHLWEYGWAFLSPFPCLLAIFDLSCMLKQESWLGEREKEDPLDKKCHKRERQRERASVLVTT